jgi:replicative DNA helicase
VICLLHREDYYDTETPRAGEIDLIVGKHRNGPTGTIALAHQFRQSRFQQLAH